MQGRDGILWVLNMQSSANRVDCTAGALWDVSVDFLTPSSLPWNVETAWIEADHRRFVLMSQNHTVLKSSSHSQIPYTLSKHTHTLPVLIRQIAVLRLCTWETRHPLRRCRTPRQHNNTHTQMCTETWCTPQAHTRTLIGVSPGTVTPAVPVDRSLSFCLTSWDLSYGSQRVD